MCCLRSSFYWMYVLCSRREWCFDRQKDGRARHSCYSVLYSCYDRLPARIPGPLSKTARGIIFVLVTRSRGTVGVSRNMPTSGLYLRMIFRTQNARSIGGTERPMDEQQAKEVRVADLRSLPLNFPRGLLIRRDIDNHGAGVFVVISRFCTTVQA